MTCAAIQLSEWSRYQPKPGSPLFGRCLSTAGRDMAEYLTNNGRMEVLELAQGLEIRTNSWVGRVVLGDLTITIQPKITGAPMLHLLRYAYGLRNLDLVQDTSYIAAEASFQDLICHQLAVEARELIAHGLHRDYERIAESLSSPRGRLDVSKYTQGVATASTTLPYIHHPRTEATNLNGVLLAGLDRAAGICNDLELRGRLRRLSRRLEIKIPPVRLDRATLERTANLLDRRTGSYRPALTLIGLLLDSSGTSLDTPDEETFPLPGFLFDMNRFFQALISRFLHDYLESFVVQDEYRLKSIFTYDPAHNPLRHRSPTPRPDFMVMRGHKVAAVLDAKYRDLWEKALPADMLYQLAIYALLQDSSKHESVILYPTIDSGAVEQIITLHEPARGMEQAQVILRPVKLLELEQLLRPPNDYSARQKRCELAEHFAFGI